MGFKFNPFTGTLDQTDSPNGVFEAVEVNGDITLDDGGTYATTLQLITPTANRTISFPDATGTVGLVGGSSGQLVYNNAGVYAGLSTFTTDGTNVTLTGRFISSLNGAASAPPGTFTGTWFTGGTSTTTKPQLLIEPTGTTSTAWSTDGTGLGVNAASGFAGRLFDFQVNGSSKAVLTGAGLLGLGTSSPQGLLHVQGVSGSAPVRIVGSSTGSSALAFYNNAATTNRFVIGQGYVSGSDNIAFIQNDANAAMVFGTNATERLRIDSSGRVGVGTTSPQSKASFLTTSVPASNPTWSDSWVSVGPNVGSSTGAALGLGYDSSGDEGYLVSLAPGVAFKPLNIQANVIKFQAGSSGEDARIDSSGRLLVGTSSSRTVGSPRTVQIEGTASTYSGLTITHNSATTSAPVFSLAKTRGSTVGSNTIVQAGDELGYITFNGADGTDANQYAAWIRAVVEGTPANDSIASRLEFSTTADGASSPTERMRIGNNGSIYFGSTSGTAPSMHFSADTGGGRFIKNTNSTNSRTAFTFQINGTDVGSITTSLSSTAYNTSSDYRLKENVTAVTDGITRLQQLKPSRFNFIADPSKTVDGFLAHEVQDIVPEAITGEKDEVDDEGNPVYQGIDQSKLVPLLTAALQEAIGEIESLKARVAALESA